MRVEPALLHLRQHRLPETGRHAAHFPRDGGVVRGQAGVAALRVDHAHPVPAAGKIERDLLRLRVSFLEKVQQRESPDGARGLVHQPARLAEILVFGIPADLRDGERGHLPAAEQAVHDGPHQHLERGGGRQPGAGQHLRPGVGAEPARPPAPPGESRADSADQRLRGVLLPRLFLKVPRLDFVRREPLRLHADPAVLRARGDGHGVQVHPGREHAAALVVGVVPAHFRPAGRAEDRDVPARAVQLLKPLHRFGQPPRAGLRAPLRAAVNPRQALPVPAPRKLFLHLLRTHCRISSPSVSISVSFAPPL